jgi:glyoxylase I family protein
MRIKLTSLMVEDQDKALHFYTAILGFEKKREIPMGQHKWLSVSSSEDPAGAELSLEPNVNPAGKSFQEAMYAQGIPLATFEVTDLNSEFARLSALGVAFAQTPTNLGDVSIAKLDDTCGNWIQLYQVG